MEYTTKIGDRPTLAHINYRCPCGCLAGLTYDRQEGSEHLGMCCCGRLLWGGHEAEYVVKSHFKSDHEYALYQGSVTLPWGESQHAVLAVPFTALADEKAKRDAGKVPTKVVDPVCGMMFDPDAAAATSLFRDTTYCFCAEVCRTRFETNPKQYARKTSLLQRLLGRAR